MNLDRTLRLMRRHAESLMADTCEIVRRGDPVTDPETGVAATRDTLVYRGRCKVQTAGGLASENTEGGLVQALGSVAPVWSLYLHLPYGVQGPRSGDTVRIVRSADQTLTGRRYRLVNPQSEKTHATAQRWNIQAIGGHDG